MADTGPRGPQGPAGTSIDLPISPANLALANYVEDEGDIDGWHCRKWSNGWAECWATHEFTPATGQNSVYLDLPFTFATTPVVNAGIWIDGDASSRVQHVKPYTNANVVVYYYSNQAGATGALMLTAAGRWK